MDWKVFMMTFFAIFAAELADKTQLVGIGMAARTGKPVTVWCASVLAYLVITALAVMLGAVAGKYLRPELIRYTGASLFVIIGMLMFAGKV